MRRAPVAVLCVSLLVSQVAAAQTFRFGKHPPRDVAATEEAGIGSYSLTREIDKERGLDVAHTEIFDTSDNLKGTCQLHWPEGTSVITCSMEDGGQYRATWHADGTRFEDLVSGDSLSVTVERKPPTLKKPQLLDPRGTPLSELPKLLFEGTTSLEEAERKWGHITTVLGYVVGEIDTTLNTGPYRTPRRRPTEGKEKSSTNSPQPVQLCEFGEPSCTRSGLIGEGTGSFPTQCCTIASLDADYQCVFWTGLGCCANTLCSVSCLFGFCDCTVGGYIWECPPDPCELAGSQPA